MKKIAKAPGGSGWQRGAVFWAVRMAICTGGVRLHTSSPASTTEWLTGRQCTVKQKNTGRRRGQSAKQCSLTKSSSVPPCGAHWTVLSTAPPPLSRASKEGKKNKKIPPPPSEMSLASLQFYHESLVKTENISKIDREVTIAIRSSVEVSHSKSSPLIYGILRVLCVCVCVVHT